MYLPARIKLEQFHLPVVDIILYGLSRESTSLKRIPEFGVFIHGIVKSASLTIHVILSGTYTIQYSVVIRVYMYLWKITKIGGQILSVLN